MEAVALLSCSLLAGLASWILLVPGSGEGAGVGVRLRVVAHALRRALRALAASPLCATLLQTDSFRSAVEEVEQSLSRAGISLSAEELAAAIVVGASSVCVAAGAFARSVLVAVAAMPLVVAVFPLRAAQRSRALERELAEQMPGVFRTLATAMGSGQTLMQALDYVGLNEGGPAAESFGRASLRLRCGMSAEDALARLSDELDAPGAELMATALSISQRTGSPLRDLFQRSALLVEQQGEFRRMLQVKTAQVRLSVRIVCVLPMALVVLLSLISPDFRQGLHTVAGAACLLVGALMDGAALLLIRSILKGVM